MNITVVGMGYVGLSVAVLLARNNHVKILEVCRDKVEMLNSGTIPIYNEEIRNCLKKDVLDIYATSNQYDAYTNTDYIIIALPTNLNSKTGKLDTKVIEKEIAIISKYNPQAVIIVKSTTPIGFTKELAKKYKPQTFLCAPEFLRETSAFFDICHPNRIVVGLGTINEQTKSSADFFCKLIEKAIVPHTVPIYIVGSDEAEAIKLFSNEYLALRIAFFNELDMFAEKNELNVLDIIDGLCADERIGNYYNNPSFGYSGYCLPKDSKHLITEFKELPQRLIKAVNESNAERIKYIAEKIYSELEGNCVGIYRIQAKSNSDNFRYSNINYIIQYLNERGIKVIIYEPLLQKKEKYCKCKIIKDFNLFKNRADLIVANRYSKELDGVMKKVYTRDIFNRD